jgi:hypothetical protein
MALPRPPRVDFVPTHADDAVIRLIEMALTTERFRPRSQTVLRFALFATARMIGRSQDSEDVRDLLRTVLYSTPNLSVRSTEPSFLVNI